VHAAAVRFELLDTETAWLDAESNFETLGLDLGSHLEDA
jgi:hypothetical protein